ncbi:MAG: pectate lyase, partial [Prevotella sp.]|nr:pectate lyase [Prevotella sp.]
MADDVPAFPGAEGHGRYVTGGRGGEVRHVTSLEDDGSTSTTGTLRWAVNGSAKKIVVFDVGGVIPLIKDLVIGDNTTIAGQTAPSPGITIRYYTVRPGSNNIIRFIRIRRGQERDLNDGADAMWQRNKTGMIIDHCSFSWS